MKLRPMILLAISLWLFISIGLKTQRYFLTSHVRDDLRLGNIISKVMIRLGWTEINRKPDDETQALRLFQFKKPGCDRVVLLTFVNFGEATGQVLKDALGRDVIYIQNGQATNAPPAPPQNLVARMAAALFSQRFEAGQDMPILVLSDYKSNPACAVDLLPYWDEIRQKFRLTDDVK